MNTEFFGSRRRITFGDMPKRVNVSTNNTAWTGLFTLCVHLTDLPLPPHA